MGGVANSFQALARDAAERLDRARAVGEQLELLPAEPIEGGEGKAGRGKGKAVSQLRAMLAAKGFRLPEEQLARIAGLDSAEDAVMAAMAKAEKILAWAYGKGTTPKAEVRLATFMQVYAAQVRAAEALLPYGLAKITPDAAPVVPVQVNIHPQAPAPAAPGAPPMRDVTPPMQVLAPPPMPWEMQQNQAVADAEIAASDDARRTEGASD
jgi:hypothetical protein